MKKKNEYKTPKMEVVALKHRGNILQETSGYDLNYNEGEKDITIPV